MTCSRASGSFSGRAATDAVPLAIRIEVKRRSVALEHGAMMNRTSRRYGNNNKKRAKKSVVLKERDRDHRAPVGGIYAAKQGCAKGASERECTEAEFATSNSGSKNNGRVEARCVYAFLHVFVSFKMAFHVKRRTCHIILPGY